MASLSRRYRDGEFTEVWRELDRHRLSVSDSFALGLSSGPTDDDIEDVMGQTFERVARNVDRLVERLRDGGYRFECESGRYGPPEPPRIACETSVFKSFGQLNERFKDGLVHDETLRLFPNAFVWFARIVGIVDLRQATPYFGDDSEPGSQIMSQLSDWDPLVFDPRYGLADIEENDLEMLVLPDGGMGVTFEFAPSFEHKADVSGALNPHIVLPTDRNDPTVIAEEIHLAFTDYLRRIFVRGGFYGVPRVVRQTSLKLYEIEPSIYLPTDPVFDRLACGLEHF